MYWLTNREFDELEPGERVLVESTGVNQEPDMSPEATLFFQLESLIASAEGFIHDLERSGGMTRELAMEMHAVWPDLAEKHPILEYTRTPSQTLYRISLEEIDVGIAAAIAAGFAAVLAIIYKLWQWMSGGKDKNDAVSESRADIDKTTEKLKTAEEVTRSVDSTAGDLKEVPREIQEATIREIEAAIKKADVQTANLTVSYSKDHVVAAAMRLSMANHHVFMTVMNTELFSDVVNNGPWIKKATESATLFQKAYPILMQRIEAIKKIAAADPSHASEAYFSEMKHYFEKFGSHRESDEALERIARELVEHHDELDRKHAHQEIDADLIGKRLGEIERSGTLATIGQARLGVYELAAHLEDLLKSMKWMANPETVKQVIGDKDAVEHGKLFRQLHADVVFLSHVMTRHYKSANLTFHVISKYATTYTDLVSSSSDIVKVQLDAAAKASSGSLKAKAENVVNRLKHYMFGKKKDGLGGKK